MNIFYEEAGAFKVGKVLEQLGNVFQVETQHGKRTKVKSNAVMVEFKQPSLDLFVQEVEQLSEEVDIQLLWECAPAEEFLFSEMADVYFGDQSSVVQQGAILKALHAQPIYFHRKGKGKYKAAPVDVLHAALAGLERKRVLAEQQAELVESFLQGTVPCEVKAQLPQLLIQPDKNSIEYKALQEVCAKVGQSPEALLLNSGLFSSVRELMRAKFVAQYFPEGVVVKLAAPLIPDTIAQLPVSNAVVFSIDDSSTTEIDDAFSVTWLNAEHAQVGVHIAAPALFLDRNSAGAKLAHQRLSTVYSPGEKITMLPDAIINMASLNQGQQVPVVSLYVRVNCATGTVISEPHSVIEQVVIANNLRHDQLDHLLTDAVLNGQDAHVIAGVGDLLPALRVLWRSANVFRQQREAVRGQPEKKGRIDFTFSVNSEGWVEIKPRLRDAPLDLLVSEWMIYSNSTWGGFLATHQVAGIYRTQPAMGRVKMSIHKAPHAGLGVEQYAWCTSPLRRCVDLINQQQLVSILQSTAPAYEIKSSELLGLISAFDFAYKAYADYQSNMERYWCLKWLQQQDRKQFEGVVVNDELVRLHEIPLFVRLVGVTSPGQGAQVMVELSEIDELSLSVSCKLLSIQNSKPTQLIAEGAGDFALSGDGEVQQE